MFWVLGTLLMPEACFPLYFWRIKPELIWTCPACSGKNNARSRKCAQCERFFTSGETAERLHGYFKPSDAAVIFFIAWMTERFGHLAILMTSGSDVLSEGVRMESVSHTHLYIVELVVANVLIWLCIHCIAVRYRRSMQCVGLRREFELRSIIPPLLIAPLVYLISVATVNFLSSISGLNSLSLLDDLLKAEQRHQAIYMPHGLDATIILVIFVSLFLSPFAEEILFRGIAYPALCERWGHLTGLFGSAFFFAVFHGGPIQLFPSFILGVISALLFRQYRSLIPSLLTHSLVHLISLVMWLQNT